MSETVEVNGVEVEVSETDDGYEASKVVEPEPVAKFTDAYDDTLVVPLSDGFVVESIDDESKQNEYVVGLLGDRLRRSHTSAGGLVDDDRVTHGYYFNEMETAVERVE